MNSTEVQASPNPGNMLIFENVTSQVGDKSDPDMQPERPAPYLHARGMEPSLADFFSRPVLLPAIAWTSASLNSTRNYITDYFANTAVRRKVSDYLLMRAKIHFRFIVQGNPQYYGLLRICVAPTGGGAVSGNNPTIPTYNHFPNNYVNLAASSLLPHVDLNPAVSTQVEMVLPFVHRLGWYSLESTANVADVWSFRTMAISNLASSTAIAPSAPVVPYCWMTDVEFSVPATIALSSNWNEAKPSAILSTMASAMLKSGPKAVVPPLATAAGAAAALGASVAAAAGFSKPQDIVQPSAMYSRSFGNMANYEGTDNSVVLAPDPKIGLSVDSSIMQFGSPEDMDLQFLYRKWTHMEQRLWSSATAVGSNIVVVPVTPNFATLVAPVSSGTSTNGYAGGPLLHSSQAFLFWTGCLEYRFKFFGNAYHRGMLRIRHWPQNSVFTGISANDPGNTNSSVVLDLSTGNEIVVKVPWVQQVPYAGIGAAAPLTVQTTPTGQCNGSLIVEVLAPLTGPDPASFSIGFSTEIRAGDDFKFARFDMLKTRNWTFVANTFTLSTDWNKPSAAFEVAATKADLQLQLATCGEVRKDNLVFFGENITSVRQLIKLSYPVAQYNFPYTGNTTALQFRELTIAGLPVPSNFPMSAAGTILAKTQNLYSFAPLTWFLPMYLGFRGGVNFRFLKDQLSVSSGVSPFSTTVVITLPSITSNGSMTASSNVAPNTLGDILFPVNLYNTGSAVSVFRDNIEAVAVNVPMRTNSMWDYGQKAANNNSFGEGVRMLDWVAPQFNGASHTSPITLFVAAADDYTMLGFLAVPIFFSRVPV